MATDATGVATSPDGIPTYNTSVDAPSGLGHNAAMAAIQTALNARVSKPSGIASGEVPVWNGAGWDRSSVTKMGLSSLTDPGSGKVVGSVGSGAVAVFPPGYEAGYATVTADVATASLTDVALATLATSVAFENVKYYVEASIPLLRQTAAGNSTFFNVYVDGVALPIPAQNDAPGGANGGPAFYRWPWTPAAGNHTVAVQWHVSAGTATIRVTSLIPATFRIVKA